MTSSELSKNSSAGTDSIRSLALPAPIIAGVPSAEAATPHEDVFRKMHRRGDAATAETLGAAVDSPIRTSPDLATSHDGVFPKMRRRGEAATAESQGTVLESTALMFAGASAAEAAIRKPAGIKRRSQVRTNPNSRLEGQTRRWHPG